MPGGGRVCGLAPRTVARPPQPELAPVVESAAASTQGASARLWTPQRSGRRSVQLVDRTSTLTGDMYAASFHLQQGSHSDALWSIRKASCLPAHRLDRNMHTLLWTTGHVSCEGRGRSF